MEVLRAGGYATVPWKNGGGTTREIAVARDPAAPDGFLWRLSIATVDRAGPFSRFPGIDRTIALLSGAGMHLASAEGRVLVGPETEPYAFPGEADIDCTLVAGRTIDLNAMTRRDRWRHRMRRERFAGDHAIRAAADLTFIVANAPVRLAAHGGETLGPLDTLAGIASGAVVRLHADGPAEVFVIALSEHGG